MNKLIKVILFAPIITIIGCTDADFEIKVSKHVITKIFSCTDARSDSFSGYHPGFCRVELDNDIRTTMYAPLTIGDKVDCEERYSCYLSKDNRIPKPKNNEQSQ